MRFKSDSSKISFVRACENALTGEKSCHFLITTKEHYSDALMGTTKLACHMFWLNVFYTSATTVKRPDTTESADCTSTFNAFSIGRP